MKRLVNARFVTCILLLLAVLCLCAFASAGEEDLKKPDCTIWVEEDPDYPAGYTFGYRWPEATMLEFCFTYPGGRESVSYYSGYKDDDGYLWCETVVLGIPGEIKVSVRASISVSEISMETTEEEIGWTDYVDAGTITAREEMTLTVPELNLPQKISKGESITLNFPAGDENINYWVYITGPDGERINWQFLGSQGAVWWKPGETQVLSGDWFTKDGIYQLQVSVDRIRCCDVWQNYNLQVGETYQITADKALKVTNPSVYGEVPAAAAETRLRVAFDSDAAPETGKYFTGGVLMMPDNIVLQKEGYRGIEFTMPAHDITLTPVQEDQAAEYELDLTGDQEVKIEEKVITPILTALAEYGELNYTQSDFTLSVDLNRDGVNDAFFSGTYGNDGLTVTGKRLEGADSMKEDHVCRIQIPTYIPFAAVRILLVKKNNASEVTEGNGVYSLSGDEATLTEPAGSSVTELTIPGSFTANGKEYKVTAIADNAFKGLAKLKKVTIGDNVVKIGKNAFSGCSKLKTVSGLAGVTTIGDGAFQKCTALTKIRIPEKVKKIGKNAFSGCKKLKTIEIRTKLLTKKNVGANAFKDINKKATFKCPGGMAKNYEKILRKKGVPKTAKFK